MESGERNWLQWRLADAGLARRDLLRFCSTVAGMFFLPSRAAADIAAAVQNQKKPTLIWLEFQDCAGNTESLLRARRPSVAEILLDAISIDYHETIMAAAGHRAEKNRDDAVKNLSGQYLAVVEGSIPTGEGGAFCTIGGRSAQSIAQEVCGHSAATIAIGTCAAFGGIPAARPNPTGALGVEDAVTGLKNLINLPACPVNVDNLSALIAYYLTYQRWPPLDRHRRPLFAYGKSVHDNCERRAHFDAGQYVETWGDAAHRNGYCLYKVGCKGPVAAQNCPVVRWNDGTSWPVGCGHPCIGCSEPDFWDAMTPFYHHLRGVPGFARGSDIDKIGMWAVTGVGASFAAHTLVHLGRRKLKKQYSEPELSKEPPGGDS